MRIHSIAVLAVLVFWMWLAQLSALPPNAGVEKPNTAGQVQTHLAHAQQALAGKRLDEAVGELNEAIRIDPKNVEALGNLGVVQFLQGKYPQASQSLRAALKVQPNLWKAQAILGLCETAQGNFDSARSLLEESYPHLQDPNWQVRAGMALAELDYQHHDLDRAAEVLAALQKSNSSNVDVLYAAYRVHTDLAAQARDNLALVAPDSARMHQLLAEHMITEGDSKGAIVQFQEAMRIDPRLPSVHFELGEAFLAESMSDESQQAAQKEFETAVQMNPMDAKAECRLGALASLHNNADDATRHYQRAVALAPDDSEAQVGLGKMLLAAGRTEDAAEHLSKAVAIDPFDAQGHYRLSQALRRLGRTADADHEVAVFKQIREARERLRSAYVHLYKESKNVDALNPDVPK